MIRIQLKSYKKQIFIHYLNLFKEWNKKKGTKKLGIVYNIQKYLPLKTKIRKYALLRATHEFKYSWEKYIERISKLSYENKLSHPYNVTNIIMRKLFTIFVSLKKREMNMHIYKKHIHFTNTPGCVVINIHKSKNIFTTTKIQLDAYIKKYVLL
jgi:ribosomal protein S10